eukprot:CAMPEP_0113455884 /NCGR_PEP_ID=MMETSP0014_2-20120614/8602_1 /TAXON_ID=2857 /ORGANISM="Nitzschia sp." /LENGTH=232 /DNA_ID=CAMNT_0000347321 /DNA_START=50 /DNA_END=748 /DNA_ORIENTATION=+ /assembly_acc=CAM_ASM_000159
MALRLSASSNPSTMQQSMDSLMNDTSLSLEQKLDVVKTLSTVLRNLEKKGTDIKYRTLNLNNEKLQGRLFSFLGTESLLLNVVGFTKTDGGNELVLKDAPSSFFLTRLSQEWLPVLLSTQSTLISMGDSNSTDASTAKKAKLTKSSSSLSSASTSSSTSTSMLSEKQKARRLLEEKKEKEKMEAKLAKERTRAQIAADKRVRMEDENWKPSVSAAAAKGGTQLQTFRDRHGE